MGIRIRTNATSLTAQRHLNNNSQVLNKSIERLSSGYRINKSGDDAAGLAVAENMRAEIRGLGQAKRNANDALSMLQVAEGSMSEMGNILVRMRELSVRAASDTFGDRDRAFLNREYVQLAKEIDRIAATTEFNGNKFFVADEDNPRSNYVIQVGLNHTSPEMNQDTLAIELEGLRLTTKDLGIGTEAEIGPHDLESGDSGPSRDEIAEKLTVLDKSLEKLASERATVGSLQSRLGSTINNLSVSVENLTSSMSRIKDADYAEETATLTRQRILSQSNLSVLSQANQLPEMALNLLR